MMKTFLNMTARIKAVYAVIFALCFFACVSAFAQELLEIKAHPHRPTFSNSTVTTDPKTIEVEGGFVANPNTQSAPVLLKYGVRTGLEAFAGISPFVKKLDIGQEGMGDLSLGIRDRFLSVKSSKTDAGFQFVWKVPTADQNTGMGSGRPDFDLTFVLTQYYANSSVDVNLGGFWAGIQNTSRFEDTIYGDVTYYRTVTAKTTVFADGYLSRNFTLNNTTILSAFGFIYTIHPAFVLDLSTNINIRNGPYSWQVLAGGVINLFGL